MDMAIATSKDLKVSDQKPVLRNPIRDNPTNPRYITKATEPNPSPSTITDWARRAPTGPALFPTFVPVWTIWLTDMELTTLWSSEPERRNEIAATEIYTAKNTKATPTTA